MSKVRIEIELEIESDTWTSLEDVHSYTDQIITYLIDSKKHSSVLYKTHVVFDPLLKN